jgi:hypothetical protein
MTTALQELIEYFNQRPEYDKTYKGYEIIEKAKKLLEKEKEQIIFDYMNGKYYHQYEDITAEEYYNQTYKAEIDELKNR